MLGNVPRRARRRTYRKETRMFVLKNAWRSVVRGKGRNALIVVVVAIIAAAATIGLAIRNAAETARAEGLASTSVTATIGGRYLA